MNHDETFDTICVILEESREQGVEHAADLIMNALDHMGQDILEHLDPPPGLQRWLSSHGFALVATREVTPPRVWQSIEEEEDGEGDLEEEAGGSGPLLKVGDDVQYRTAPGGLSGQSYIGAGRISAITAEGWVIIRESPSQERWVNPQEGDLIIPRAPSRSAEAQPS
jgi:hypothetical protein